MNYAQLKNLIVLICLLSAGICNAQKKDVPISPDISGVWLGKFWGRFPYEFHLAMNPDSTWSGTSYLQGFFMVDRRMQVVQSRVRAWREGDGYIIQEVEFINGIKYIPGHSVRKFRMKKKGNDKLTGIDIAYNPTGKITFKRKSNTLNQAQQKVNKDIDHPDLEMTDLSFTSTAGGNSIGYMGKGSVDFTIKNNGSVESPTLKLGIYIKDSDLVKINGVSGLPDLRLQPGGSFSVTVDVEAIDRILTAELPIEIRVNEKETGKLVAGPKWIKIPVKQ